MEWWVIVLIVLAGIYVCVSMTICLAATYTCIHLTCLGALNRDCCCEEDEYFLHGEELYGIWGTCLLVVVPSLLCGICGLLGLLFIIVLGIYIYYRCDHSISIRLSDPENRLVKKLNFVKDVLILKRMDDDKQRNFDRFEGEVEKKKKECLDFILVTKAFVTGFNARTFKKTKKINLNPFIFGGCCNLSVQDFKWIHLIPLDTNGDFLFQAVENGSAIAKGYLLVGNLETGIKYFEMHGHIIGFRVSKRSILLCYYYGEGSVGKHTVQLRLLIWGDKGTNIIDRKISIEQDLRSINRGVGEKFLAIQNSAQSFIFVYFNSNVFHIKEFNNGTLENTGRETSFPGQGRSRSIYALKRVCCVDEDVVLLDCGILSSVVVVNLKLNKVSWKFDKYQNFLQLSARDFLFVKKENLSGRRNTYAIRTIDRKTCLFDATTEVTPKEMVGNVEDMRRLNEDCFITFQYRKQRNRFADTVCVIVVNVKTQATHSFSFNTKSPVIHHGWGDRIVVLNNHSFLLCDKFSVYEDELVCYLFDITADKMKTIFMGYQHYSYVGSLLVARSTESTICVASEGRVLIWKLNHFERIMYLLLWIFQKRGIPLDILRYNIMLFMTRNEYQASNTLDVNVKERDKKREEKHIEIEKKKAEKYPQKRQLQDTPEVMLK